MFMYVQLQMHMYVHVKVRGQDLVISLIMLHLIFGQGLFPNLELPDLAQLSGQ